MAETNQEIIAALTKIDETIQGIGETLEGLTLSDEIRAKIKHVAELTSPKVDGIEGSPARFRVANIQLRQPISNSPSIPDTCKPGQLYSSGDHIGDSIRFIPILRHAQRKKWMEDSKIDCQSIDGKKGSRYGDCSACPYGKYTPGVQTPCSLGHTFFVVTPDLNKLYRIDFQKSSAKAGKNILSLTEPPSLWGKIFLLSTEHHATAGRNYYSLSTRATGERPDADLLAVCSVLHKFFKAQYDKALLRFANPNIFNDPTALPTGSASDVIIDTEDDGNIDFKGAL